MSIRAGIAAALVLLAACGATPPALVTLPAEPTAVTTDPARQAIIVTAYAFTHPAALAGRPDEAARVVALAEFLAADFAVNTRWSDISPQVQLSFVAARREWRDAFGISAAAPPQAVVDALFAARGALLRGDREAAAAALPPAAFPAGGPAVLARLSTLPALTVTARAASLAEAELLRQNHRLDDD